MLGLLLLNMFVFLHMCCFFFMPYEYLSIPSDENTFSKVHQHGSVIHAPVKARKRFYFTPRKRQVSYL